MHTSKESSLNRCEGGIGGDNNIINKQIRPSEDNPTEDLLHPRFRKDEVILYVINSQVEKWSFE